MRQMLKSTTNINMARKGCPASLRGISELASRIAATALLSLAAQGCDAEPPLPAINSYGQPPFVPLGADQRAGLASTFVELLNAATDGHPRFQIESVPRRRLELTLGVPSFQGIALFLAPEFLAPAAQQGAVWSEPVMVDENLIVSMRQLKPSSLTDLHGLKLGGIAGHIYRLLGPAIDDGKVRREDAPDHISNLRKLCLGRVDFVVISRSELAGTLPHVNCAEPFRITAFPEPQVIVRRVLVRTPEGGSAKELLAAVASVACGPQWIQALAQYGLSTVGCLSAVARSSEHRKRDAKAVPLKRRKTAAADPPLRARWWVSLGGVRHRERR
jgi:polar amino acid transport system substrate-binding protein